MTQYSAQAGINIGGENVKIKGQESELKKKVEH